jgi:Flp pilus assembly protein TadG
MSFLLSLPGKIAMAALVLFLAYGAGRYQGSSVAKAEMAAKALKQAVETLQQRNKVDAEINSLDAAALCAAMGLPDADYELCVSGLQEADP